MHVTILSSRKTPLKNGKFNSNEWKTQIYIILTLHNVGSTFHLQIAHHHAWAIFCEGKVAFIYNSPVLLLALFITP